jgi:hypothetical protein
MLLGQWGFSLNADNMFSGRKKASSGLLWLCNITMADFMNKVNNVEQHEEL